MNYTEAEIERRLAEADIAAINKALTRVVDQIARLQQTKDELEADLTKARQKLARTS